MLYKISTIMIFLIIQIGAVVGFAGGYDICMLPFDKYQLKIDKTNKMIRSYCKLGIGIINIWAGLTFFMKLLMTGKFAVSLFNIEHIDFQIYMLIFLPIIIYILTQYFSKKYHSKNAK